MDSISGALIMYQKLKDSMTGADANCIKRLADNAFIPFAEDNTDYIAYLAWLAEGGVPEPADEVTTE
jgi:hypothetical protein